MGDPIHLTDAEYEQVTLRVRELIDHLDDLPYPTVRDAVFELLQGFDLLHREALARLLHLLDAEAPRLLPRLEADYVLRTLLMLYDFIPGPEEERAALPRNGGFVPLDQVDVLEAIKQPVWIPGGRIGDLAPGTLTAKSFDGVRVLLCRIDDELFALHNACLGSILALEPGRLDGYTLVCPWHGCQYDVRTGTRLDGSGQKLPTFPVQIGDDGRFLVGFNIE